jgi:3-oxoacyl-[acyl-carrier-protein] synthase-3
VTNADLAEVLGTDPEWILKNTGIKTRRWACSSQATSDLAAEAARLAVQSANLSPDAIDYLIAGTMTPDHQIPGIAPLIQARLGLNHIPCLDIRAACCNPLYAFDVASALIHSGRAANVLIVGAEVQSKGLKLAPEAKEISALFGDGAGACVVSKSASIHAVKLVDVSLFTEGKFAKDLAVLAPGTGNGSRWFDEDPQYRDLNYPVMNGKTVILHAARKLSDAARSVLQRRNLSPEDINLVIPHQANENLLLALGRQLKIPESKIVSIVEWSGNTSSASMLIALDWAYEQKLIHSSGLILFLAFGAGFSWGAALAEVE